MKLNIGCGRNILEGWVNVDKVVDHEAAKKVDVKIDLDGESVGLAFEALFDPDTCDEFLLSHILEHLHKPLPLMQALHRVAKPGAIATIRTPYGSSDDAWEDPTHVRPYFLNSFGYFSQPFYWRADYGYRGDWRVKRISLVVGSSAVTLAQIATYRNLVTEMIAQLEAVKPIREPKRELQEAPVIELAVSQ